MTTPTANYSLPGTDVSIADLGLRITAPVPGVKLTLIGQSNATLGNLADLNEPYLIQSFPTAIQALKNQDGTDSELSLALEKAVEAGARNVEVVISFTSQFPTENQRWDALAETLDQIREHPMDIVISDKAYIDAVGLTGSDPFGDNRTNYFRMFGDFCYRATKLGNTVRAVVGARPLLETALLEGWSTAPTSEINARFDTPTLAQINEWPYHFRGEDNSSSGLHNHSAETELTGFVSGSVEQSPGVISAVYDGWAREDTGSIAVDHLGNNVDGGRAVSVVAMVARQALSSTRTRAAQLNRAGQLTENTNGAVAYATLLTDLNPGEAPTNQTIRSITQARNVPRGFATDLLNLRMVTMVNRTNGFVISKGITGAHNAGEYTRSDFVNYSTYDVMILGIDIGKNIIDRYIGKQSAPAVINALQNELDQGLHALIAAGLASRVTASIIQTRDQQILGNLDIELDIVPYGEISNVNFRAAAHRD